MPEHQTGPDDVLDQLDRDHKQFADQGHDSLFGDAAKEIRRLRRWKAEALPILAGLQELGRALGLPLGELVTGPRAVEAAENLRAEHDAARNEMPAPSASTVDLMLAQLERDRGTPYWGEDPHVCALDGAEAWLLSLRDSLSRRPVRPHDEHHPWTPLEAALVTTLADWKVDSDARPAFGEGSDRSDLMDVALTRIKGLCAGVLEPDEVMAEIAGQPGAEVSG